MDAIRNVLEIIRQNANEFLQNADRRADDWIVLTNAIGHDGVINDGARQKLVMSLYNITRETTVSTYNSVQSSGGSYFSAAPPLYVDLDIIFMANFVETHYPAGLAAISRLVSFFQQNPAFTHATTPRLDPAVDKISLELVNLSPADVNHVMGMLGTKYLPSVFYKLRMIPFQSPAMQSRSYPAQGTAVPEAPNSGEAGQ